jgi:hypothetical protein
MVQKARYVASGQKMYKERATVGVVVVGKGSQRKHTANGKKKSGCLGRGSVVMTGARVFKKQVCELKEALQRAKEDCNGPYISHASDRAARANEPGGAVSRGQ